MIRVKLAGEPANFDLKVRQKGLAYLKTLPRNKVPDFRYRSYWRAAIDDMREAYGGICAYTAMEIHDITGAQSVEHFESKSKHPKLAYEWTNFRYVCGRMNGRKGAHEDVVDPFTMPDMLFHLDFPSLKMEVNSRHEKKWGDLGRATIKRLQLNDWRSVKSRRSLISLVLARKVPLAYLSETAPFLYRELDRQELGLVKLRSMFGK